MRKAVIHESNKEVINIIECGDNGIQGLQLPLGQMLWDCSQYAVAIGDKFINGIFYRADKPVEYIPTAEQQIAMLNAEKEQLENQVLLSENEIDIRLSELELIK